MNASALLSRRSEAVTESGIRRVFEEGRAIPGAINLTLGQPDFPVAERVKAAAIEAIRADRNGYASNQGVPELVGALRDHLAWDLGWRFGPNAAPGARADEAAVMVTAGTSAALVCAAFSVLDPGDEVIIPDPYFVLYPPLAEMTGARAVRCDTYPDFRMTAERVEPLITPRTKAVILNSPANPTGAVLEERACRELLDLCRRRNVLLICDEIYDEFTYSEALTQTSGGSASGAGRGPEKRCPSPCRVVGGRPAGEQEACLVVRGFGKTYGFTGWRMGYCAGPGPLIRRMLKIQQHLYICAPTPFQWASLAALESRMTGAIAAYEGRRDLVCGALSKVTEVPKPGGAFYAFARVPERLGITATEFKDRAKARRVLVVPGSAFGGRDTHVRISFACPEAALREGVAILAELLAGA